MTFYYLAQAFYALLQVIANAMTNRWGHKTSQKMIGETENRLAITIGENTKKISELESQLRSAMRELEERMQSALKNKIDVEEYRVKIGSLHTEINELRMKLAILTTEKR